MRWSVNTGRLSVGQKDLALLHTGLFSGTNTLRELLHGSASRVSLPPIPSVAAYVLYFEPETPQQLGLEYRRLTDCAADSAAHYRRRSLAKRDGSRRTICAPDGLLIRQQRWILRNILETVPVSEHATAYQKGSSTRKNAEIHLGKRVLVKLDIRRFFDSISFSTIYGALSDATGYAPPVLTFLTKLCTLDGRLPQGACTSPALANLCMRPFDDAASAWCGERGLAYSRYCDDLTFSGDEIDVGALIGFVRAALRPYGMALNEEKTRVCREGHRHAVTGVVCNEVLRAPSAYKRRIRQEVYYIRRFGTEEHLRRTAQETYFRDGEPDSLRYLRHLAGQIDYVLSIEPENETFLGYKSVVNARLRERLPYAWG